MQPATHKLKYQGCMLLVTCLLLAIKSTEVRSAISRRGGVLRASEI